MKNQVQLIAYADRLGGTLGGTQEILEGPFAGLFGGIHLLPFFTPIDGADAGFDPTDHGEVDRRLGGWSDVRAIAAQMDVMADLIVNHVSSRSAEFRDFSARGAESPFDGMFLTFDKVFPLGASEADLLAIYRPRPALPFTPMTLADGSRRLLWTTFTPEQIDIDVRHARGRAYLDRILDVFAAGGVSIVRLDAIGYAIKRAGGSCFMMPETFEFIDDLSQQVRRRGLEVLVEVHGYYERQIEVARRVDWVYDFALPPLVLHAFYNCTASKLKQWIGIRPRNAVTVLDTHDGIGVIDIGPDSQDPEAGPGLVSDAEMRALVEEIHVRSQGQSLRATGAAAANLDLYQVNCTYYDALGRDDRRYLIARAIQFFLPGVPQVYYMGLLAGTNDMALLARTNVGRDINRHHYSRDEVGRALAQPVVLRLLELIRMRNEHPAFAGSFELAPSADHVLDLRWQHGAEFARFEIDLVTLEGGIEVSHEGRAIELSLDTSASVAPDCYVERRRGS